MRHHSQKTANVAIGHKGWCQASTAPAEKLPKANSSQVAFFRGLLLNKNLNTNWMPQKPLRTGACAISTRLEHHHQVPHLRYG